MKRFFQTIKNIFSIEDLRVRILNTVGYLIIFRLGSFIVLPGINPTLLDPERNSGGILVFMTAVTRILSEIEQGVQIDGLTSCTDDSQCPQGKGCQSDLTCK